jgi:hypothetical protein
MRRPAAGNRRTSLGGLDALTGDGATVLALRELHDVVRGDIADGRTLEEILGRNHLPKVLADHPVAVISELAPVSLP